MPKVHIPSVDLGSIDGFLRKMATFTAPGDGTLTVYAAYDAISQGNGSAYLDAYLNGSKIGSRQDADWAHGGLAQLRINPSFPVQKGMQFVVVSDATNHSADTRVYELSLNFE